MKTLMFLFLGVLLAILFVYLCCNMFVLLGSVINFHPRAIIEKLACKILLANYHSKAVTVAWWVAQGWVPEKIAAEVAGQRVILGSIILLAANHMKKTCPP